MSSIYRLWLGGPGVIMGTSVIVESAGLGVVFYYLRPLYPGLTRNLYLFGFGFLVHVGMLSLTLTLPKEVMLKTLQHIATPVLLIYPAATWLVCLLFLDQESRVSAEQALRESEERYRAVFNNAAIGIDMLDRDGKISQVNSALSEMLGYTEDELKKLTFEEITYPDDRQISKENLDSLIMRERDSYRLEQRYLRKNGEVVWGDLSTSCIKDANGNHIGAIGVIADITKRKRTEELLSMTAQRYHAILSSMYGGVLVASEEERVNFVNQAFCDLFDIQDPPDKLHGFTPPEIIQRIKNAFAEPDEAINRIQTLVDRGLPVKGEEITLNDGRTLIRDFVPLFIDGRRYGRLWLHNDITERKLAEERYQRISSLTSDIAYSCRKSTDAAYSIDWITGATERTLGYSVDEIKALKCWRNLVVDDDLPVFDSHVTGIPPGTSDSCELRVLHKDGSIVWISSFAQCVLESGSPDSLILYGGLVDITDLKRAEMSLLESNAFLDTLINAIPLPIFYKDTDGRYSGFNKSFEEFFGQTQEELVGKTVFDMYPREFAEIFHAKDLELLNNPGVQVYESQITNVDEVVHDIIFHKSTYSDSDGNVLGLIGVIVDITEPKRVRQELLQSEFRFSKAELIAGLGNWEVNLSTKKVTVSDGARKIYGVGQQELTLADIRKFPLPEYRSSLDTELTTLVRDGAPYDIEFKIRRANDDQIVDIRSIAHYDSEKNSVFGTIHDITNLRYAEESYRLLFAAIEQAAEGVIITDATGVIKYVNPAEEAVTGYSSDELTGRKANIFKSDKQDDNFYGNLWQTINAGKIWSGRFINKKKDGTEYHEDATISPVYNTSGKLTNFVALKRDVSKQIELQEQLFQAQKMEAVGTLAGGVAHDFNNLLQVVLGYSDLMLERKQEEDPDYADLQQIYQAGKRGADLVSALLTFSRKVETKYVPVDLNQEVTSVRSLLSRTIPKTVNINLHLKGNLESINADLSQVGQVLMNLGVNARDAMPDGGTLSIETGMVELDEEYCQEHIESKPGSYVLLMVSDTGQGMDKETISRIFEPFFSTKEPGKGTGLGLAIVHGIVKQHGGHIACESEPGLGTTFKIYFPAMEKERNPDIPTMESAIPRGTETILLVDDDEAIRNLGVRLLNQFGYKVITADDGKKALEIYQREGDGVSLVILDLIMPVMDGKNCLEEILRINPNAKVVVASGYSDGGSSDGVMVAGAKGFVQKPYNMRQFLTTIREILGESPRPRYLNSAPSDDVVSITT